jgi:hypothetical protein
VSGVIDTGMTTANTQIIYVWDVEYEFWIEVRLEKAIEAARAAYLKLKAEKCI